MVSDLQFYKPMLKKHLEYLQKLNLPIEKTEQLAFQIIEHEIELDSERFEVEASKTEFSSQMRQEFISHVQHGFLKVV